VAWRTQQQEKSLGGRVHKPDPTTYKGSNAAVFRLDGPLGLPRRWILPAVTSGLLTIGLCTSAAFGSTAVTPQPLGAADTVGTSTPATTVASTTNSAATTVVRTTNTPATTVVRTTNTPATTVVRTTNTPATTITRTTNTPATTITRTTNTPATTVVRTTNTPATTVTRTTNTSATTVVRSTTTVLTATTNTTLAIAPPERCDPNYRPCVPIASDVDCLGSRGNGPAYILGPVMVVGVDIYYLDYDRDGIGCE
jgi:hypothetical protein